MDVAGRKISVVGAARSGVAAALLLRRHGAEVFVSEYGRIGGRERSLLDRHGIGYEEGGHGPEVREADCCVVSPGVPGDAPVIRALEDSAVPLVSEIEAAFWFCPARIIGVTGTDGKTTTATLIAAVCAVDAEARGYCVHSVGNIGVPFSSLVDAMGERDIAVVELSSYQLERCDSFRPEVAVITNIAPDHLDRYGGSMQRYAEAKYRIFRRQEPGDSLVYNAGNPVLRERFADGSGVLPHLVPFAPDLPDVPAGTERYATMDGDWLTLVAKSARERVIDTESLFKRSFRGRHNLENALAAAAAAAAALIPVPAIREGLASFGGVEHRQEYVRTVRGADWINDSKATNLNAMRQALESSPGRLVLIAGGRDKGSDFGELLPVVRRKVDTLVTFGEARETIAEAWGRVVDVVRADSLAEAVAAAAGEASPGRTVLFSPGCSSFDMFRDFEERGRAFKKLVQEVSE